MFAKIRERDILLHHPYDSFSTSVQTFLQQAAADPQVLAIKQTLYRTSGDSPIVDALIDAAEAGKQVLALVEIKARFDEQNNISWARKLEQAGVHVVYGIVGLKTHCKLSLVVRQESDGLRRYCHIGTGNYNPKTARLYTDHGLLTSDPEVGPGPDAAVQPARRATRPKSRFHRLLVAPRSVRAGLIERIDREADAARTGQPAWIKIKVNSMVDEATIDALYRASQAGVPIDMVVRGICALRPGVPGLSETIRVRSILGRFLEHSRIFAFAQRDGAGDAAFEGPEVYIGSADLMHRNLDRRVEALVRIADPDQVSELIELMDESTDDGTSSWHLEPGRDVAAAPPRPGRPARGPAGRVHLPAAAPAGHGTVTRSARTGRRRGGRGPGVARPAGHAAGRARAPAALRRLVVAEGQGRPRRDDPRGGDPRGRRGDRRTTSSSGSRCPGSSTRCPTAAASGSTTGRPRWPAAPTPPRCAPAPPVPPASPKEIDQLRWFDVVTAAKRLTRDDDRAPLAELVEAYEKGRLDTRALVIARHGTARRRVGLEGHGAGPAAHRRGPAAGAGAGAGAVDVRRRAAWSPARGRAASARSRPTRRPRRSPPRSLPVLTEAEHSTSPARVAAEVLRLLELTGDAVLCTHRPVLPDGGRRAGAARPPQRRRRPAATDPFLHPAQVLVAHVAQTPKGPRVVATETHRPGRAASRIVGVRSRIGLRIQ